MGQLIYYFAQIVTCDSGIFLDILWNEIKVNFSLTKELKPKYLFSCFVKRAPGP